MNNPEYDYNCPINFVQTSTSGGLIIKPHFNAKGQLCRFNMVFSGGGFIKFLKYPKRSCLNNCGKDNLSIDDFEEIDPLIDPDELSRDQEQESEKLRQKQEQEQEAERLRQEQEAEKLRQKQEQEAEQKKIQQFILNVPVRDGSSIITQLLTEIDSNKDFVNTAVDYLGKLFYNGKSGVVERFKGVRPEVGIEIIDKLEDKLTPLASRISAQDQAARKATFARVIKEVPEYGVTIAITMRSVSNLELPNAELQRTIGPATELVTSQLQQRLSGSVSIAQTDLVMLALDFMGKYGGKSIILSEF